MHKSKKLIALIAALAILFAAFAPVSAAQSPETEAASVQRVGEVVSLRQTDSETYLLSDGTYECVVYAGDKYYKDETDALRLIDNTLIPVTASSSRAGSYKNTANAFDVYFSGSGTPEVTMQYGGSSITFSPINTSLGTSNRIDATDQVIAIGAIDNCTVLSNLTPTGDNTITYSNAFASTDLVYVLENQMLKEYIILNSSNAPNTFRFMFTLEGLTLQTVGGTTCFVDENGMPVFSLASLYAVDSAGFFTEAVTYTCTPVKDTGNVIITVTLAEEYLSDPQRSYPVVIDPTVMISSAETADTYISSANPDANYYLDANLRTGRDVPYGIRRSYMKFNIPSGINGSNFISASLDLEKASGAEPAVTAYSCAFAWSSSSLTWNNQPSYYSAYSSTVSAPRASGSSWYTMDVTNIVNRWARGSLTNHGFVLMDANESSTSHWTTFYSSDAPSPHKPELHIHFAAQTVNLQIQYNQAYKNRYTSASTRIANQAAALQEKYFNTFGIMVQYSISEFWSYADNYCTTSPTQRCTHADDSMCFNSIGPEHLEIYHHTNFHNNIMRVPFPDTTSTLKMVYMGHNYCVAGQHDTFPFAGSAYEQLGLAAITNFTSDTQELKTMVHEFGHLYGAPDHYGLDTIPSTIEIQNETNDFGYSSNCIYGENRNNDNIAGNLIICEGCLRVIRGNINRYSHGN